MANPISHITIVHSSREGYASIKELLYEEEAEPKQAVSKLIALLSALQAGVRDADVYLSLEEGSTATKASKALTIASQPDAGGDVTLGSVVLTWVAGAAANENEVSRDGATVTANAEALVAAINGHSKLKGVVLATNVAGVVTVTYAIPGKAGNLFTIAENSAATSWAGGATALSGGAAGDATDDVATRTYDLGGTS